MQPPHTKQQALDLIAAGHNACEVSRRLGVPRRTILDWRRPAYQRRTGVETCPRCWRAAKPMRFTPEDYAELLALYLGDGCISDGPRAQRLRLHLDAAYPVMNAEIKSLLERCFPENRVATVVPGVSSWSGRSDTWVVLAVYSQHLGCVIPQHGVGKKHQRRIVLERWQEGLVAMSPWSFLRGCIRSDGCVFINRTGPYEYLSYDFSNMSEDITGLFTAACEFVGIDDYRVNRNRRGLWDVRINRRASVARMLEHVGVKA